jgi:hypothetical protein
MPLEGKRIILCLDGTWVNSDKGYNRPTAQDPNDTLAIPTNVTRVYRSLRKRGFDGESQVMYYHPGVGSAGGVSDSIAGGVFGTGVSEVRPKWLISTQRVQADIVTRISGKRTVLLVRIMNLVTRLFYWGFRAVRLLREV